MQPYIMLMQSFRRPMINCDVIGHLSCAIFICYCFHCLIFVWLHNIPLLPVSVFCLLSFDFHSMIFHIHFYLPSSGFCSHFPSLLTYFHIPYSISMPLCSISILSLHHLSIIPRLPSPSLTTQHFVSCDSASHFLHSSYYPVHCITLSPIVYKSLWLVVSSLACNCHYLTLLIVFCPFLSFSPLTIQSPCVSPACLLQNCSSARVQHISWSQVLTPLL